jgi:glucan-binding YG repeat protein
MEIFNADKQKNLEINNLLQKIKYKADRQKPDTFIYFPLKVEDNAKFSTLYLFGKLKTLGAIKIICHSVDKIDKKIKKHSKPKTTSIKGWLIKPIEPKFSQLCKEYEERVAEKFEEKTILQKSKDIVPIKNIRLDTSNHFLEINNGEKIISFRSKKGKEGLEKETKQFKILYHLWDFRWELKNNRIITKGDFASLDNLTKGSGSKNPEAACKCIQRLNTYLKKAGLAVEIKGENGKYRLIIVKA